MATMNIDMLLKKYKLSQRELAESTGINENTISRYCNGTFKKIDKAHISLICKFFKCTPNDIFEIDDTVEVKPAKVLYYDDEIDEFTAGEIKGRINWDYSTSLNIPIPTSKTDNIDIPEPIQKERYNWMRGFTSLHHFESKENIKQQNRLDLKYDEEYNINSFNAIQTHINLELEVDKLVFKFLDKIMSFISLSSDVDNTVKKALEIYDKYDYSKTGLIIEQYYRLFHSFLDEYFSDSILVSTLVEINNIYNKGGLSKLSINELKELKNVINYYLDINWQLKEKTRL